MLAGEEGCTPHPGPLPASGEREDDAAVWRYSSDLHCADCDIHYADPTPSLFSFNSPIGACDTCRGFGRVIGIDFGLIVPDEAKTLREGAVRPWQTASFSECQDDLVKYANKRGIPLDTPFRKLSAAQRKWVLEGEPEWQGWRKSWPGTWYGVRRFFDWLETKAYKMHIRVLLSKYRAYTPCPACEGARLKHDALLWRLGTKQDADKVFGTYQAIQTAGREMERRPARRAARAHHARPDAAADRALPHVFRQPCISRRRWTKPPTSCSPKSARGFPTCARWASPI